MSAIDITRAGLRLVGAPREPLVVSFDDQYVWSFTPGRDGEQRGETTTIAWPRVLVPYLTGHTTVRVATYDGSVVLHDSDVAFDDAPDRVAFVDETGAPYSIDKVGHLTRSFEETSAAVKQELLDASALVLKELRERCGVEAYLCYGALLGAVRQGTMLGHDSDVDLCYYTRYTSPADIIAESYRIQRTLRELDWMVLRMSAADMKVIWPLSDGRGAHIDIFSAFTIPDSSGGTFYQFGNRNGKFDVEEHLLPLGTVTLEGQEFPAPKHPEAMLSFIYGENWRVPDPGFRYQDSPIGTRRLDGWFRGFRTEVPRWLAVFQPPLLDRVPRTPSSFAQWVEPQLAPDAKVLDLGTGTARDAFFFAHQGHRVLATDYSRPGIGVVKTRVAQLAAEEPEVADRIGVDTVVLNEARMVMRLAASLARDPHDLYARGLIGSLDEEARHHLFRMASVGLRAGGALYLEFSALVEGEDLPLPEPVGLTRRFDVAWLTKEIEAHGGTVEYVEVAPGTDMFDLPDPAVARMKVVFSRG